MFIFKFRSRFRFWFRFSFVGQALMQNHQQARITCFLIDWLTTKKMLFKSFRVSMCSSHVESSQVKSSQVGKIHTRLTRPILYWYCFRRAGATSSLRKEDQSDQALLSDIQMCFFVFRCFPDWSDSKSLPWLPGYHSISKLCEPVWVFCHSESNGLIRNLVS